jgi:hypothetical protein
MIMLKNPSSSINPATSLYNKLRSCLVHVNCFIAFTALRQYGSQCFLVEGFLTSVNPLCNYVVLLRLHLKVCQKQWTVIAESFFIQDIYQNNIAAQEKSYNIYEVRHDTCIGNSLKWRPVYCTF